MRRGAPACRPARRDRDRDQRGAVLLLFVLLVVGLLGLAGLVLDLGLARVVQGRMESAVEGAALTGLAWRDVPLADGAATRELARREAARAVLLRAFDEDGRALDALAAGSAPNTRLALGVGPDLSVAGDGVAGGLVSIASAAVVPDPQLNLDNAPHGDLVAGEFFPGVDPDTCATALGLPTGFPENAAYERCDFDAPDAAGAPGIAQRQPSFLARLRRTADPDGLDDLPGVSWRAPTLPYLLGRGAAIHGDGSAAANAGIALRGTALADARPALVASVPNAVEGGGLAEVPTDTNADGVADTTGVLAIEVTGWASCFDGAAAFDVRFEPGGAVVVSTGSPCADGTVVGRVIAPGLVTPGLVAAGEPAPSLGDGLALAGSLALVALVAPVDGGGGPVDRVVGFGAVEISAPLDGLLNDAALRRLQGGDGDGLVLPRAASAVFVPARHPALDAPTLQALLSASAALPFAARAPVLVR